MTAPTDIPPKIQPPRPLLMVFAGATLAFAGLAGAAVLFFFDPSKHSFYPICQFHRLTGLYCPGCGGTRACYQLLHGNLMMALHDNALFVVSLAALAARGAWFLDRQRRGRPVRFFIPPAALWILLAVALIFVVLRNLPAFSCLAPE
ncbi:MAG TPA: DUF2752 domain-containing protein [Verrucomicrobiae bacterium]|nr:DUF2752 domain-containing protein [Verrucomicrobiae bacterium]